MSHRQAPFRRSDAPPRRPGSPRFAGRAAAAALLLLTTAGCGTLSRQGDRIVPAIGSELLGDADPRMDAAELQTLSADIERRLEADTPFELLAISGGGANGAFGAGVIAGWTSRGTRPKFAVVTGVSTGALTAPFAFLGPEWDDELAAAYAGGAANGLLNWRGLAFLRSPSLFSSGRLHALISEGVTPRMLDEIAAEHAKGRRLLVVTTNLDTEATIIWDMGALASLPDRPRALKLFREVLLASASVPGIFPPVLIPAAPADKPRPREMHVDGAVTTPFLAVPEGMLLVTKAAPAPAGSALYLIINGRLDREAQVTPGTLRGVVLRSYQSSSKSGSRTHVAANVAFAKRNGLAVRIAAMPEGTADAALDFRAEAMAALFETGRSLAANGAAWTDVVPAPVIRPDAERARVP